MAETLFTDIINNLGKAKKEGKISGGYRYKDGKLNIGGGYYGDDTMFEIDINKDGGNILFKKRFADGGSTNGSGEKAFSAKVKELMDDGYDFGEAVKEAMRQGYKNGGEVSEALLKKINNTKGIFYVPSKGEIKVRNYSRNKEGTGTKYQADKRFKLKDYKTPALALQAAKKYHYDTVLSPEAKSNRIKTASDEAAVKKNAYTKQINNWVENWIKTNSNNYSVNQADKVMKDLINDYKQTDLYKIKGPKPATLTAGGGQYPNIGRLSSGTSVGANALRMNKVPPLTGIGKAASPANFFKSLFLSEKLIQDPELKKLTSDYMDYVTENKSKLTNVEEAKRFGKMLNNPKLTEAISLLDESTIKGAGQNKFFASQFPNYKSYINKTSSSAYLKHLQTIEKTLGPKLLKQMMGTTSILNFMKQERKALTDIFDSTPLTKGAQRNKSLGYSTEHVHGIADIARIKDKKQMAKSLNVLTGMTMKKNAELGRKGFNLNRKFLISQIDKGIDSKANLKKLNELISKNTDIKGTAGKIVNGKFQYNEGAFKTTTQPQRFKQYLTELYNIPEGRAEIIKQAKNNPKLAQLVGIIENNRSGSGMYSFPAQLENVQIPESVKKALNVAGKVVKVAGKATGIIEPVFAAYNFSDAIGQGAGLKNSGQYVIEKFFEDVVNLPGLAYGAGKFGVDKIRGKDAKFETPYEVTFARTGLQENLEAMPKSQKLRNIAEKDFDVGQGASMRMVDDMEIPASKTEIDTAKEKFVESQMGPYYKYGIENLVEEEPEEKSLPNEGLLRILSNPTYKGVL